MKFTNEQIDFVNKRREELLQELARANDFQEVLSLRIKSEALVLLIELHNFQSRLDKKKKADQKKAELAAASELPDI